MAKTLYPDAIDDTKASVRKVVKTNSNVFKQLTLRSKTVVDEEVHKMSIDLLFTLRNRFTMLGGGRYPKWDGSKGVPSKHSYRSWQIKPYGDNNFALYNDASVQWKGAEFSYPRILLEGASMARTPRGWTSSSPKLNSHNGRLFSSQMPKGIDPWLVKKRAELVTRIETRMDKEL